MKGAMNEKQEIEDKGSAPEKPTVFFVMQIILGLGLVGLAVVDSFTPDTSISPIVYGVVGAIAAGPEVIKLIKPGS